MTSEFTFSFTSKSEMYAEHTFHFTPFQGAIIFEHKWTLKSQNIYGIWLGAGIETDIHLPYFTKLKVIRLTGAEYFGELHIETKAITADSITVGYWIKNFRPGWWLENITFTGILTCITSGPTESEIIRTFSSPSYSDASETDIFDFEQQVYIQATDGITSGGSRIATVVTDSGESINVYLRTTASDPLLYRGNFLLTSGLTIPGGILVPPRLHFKEFERGIIKVDINGDSVFGLKEIWARQHGPEPLGRLRVFADSTYTQEKYNFDAEELAYVLVSDGITNGGIKTLQVRADSGDTIEITLDELPATIYKGFFLVTNGPTDDLHNRIHLEPGERAILSCRLSYITILIFCRIYRLPTVTGEAISTYSDNAYAVPEDTFPAEATVYVDATAPGITGGTRELIVRTSSADEIRITLSHGPANHYRGSFKVTSASTNQDLFQIHMDSGEHALLRCDIDLDNNFASTSIWYITKPDDDPATSATHYRIQVNTQQNMLGTMMWDSQKCPFTVAVAAGERCPDIDYAGSQLDLSGRTTYWWRIKFWVNEGTEETPWSIEEAYFRGGEIAPPPDPLPDADIRKPRGKAEVELEPDIWNNLEDVKAIQISNNKNPLDRIETAQGTVYLSNIAEKFYPDKENSEWKDQLFGRRIRMSLGFLDWLGSGMPVYVQKMMGVVKSIQSNRKEKTAEIVALEFIDFYRTKEIKITPVYRDLSLSELYYELVRHCFPSWLNQHESTDWDYWVDPLGFRRTNVYLGTGEPGGSESIPLKDCLRTPCQWIYNIIADSEAIYNDDEQRLIRGTDYEIIRENTEKGVISWIRFLKEPYPTDDNHFYAAVTVDVRVEIVQYEDTTLIEELEKIILVADCRLFTDAYGRLICKSNELEETVAKDIAYNTNLMDITTRKDIDSIINHVVVESKPYQSGTEVDLGTLQISFWSRPSAEAGKERTYYFDEFVENFRFDLNWNLECMALGGLVICFGSGAKLDFTLPLRRDDETLGILLPIAGGLYCDIIGEYGELYIEFVEADAKSLTIKAYLIALHPQAFDNSINFTVSLTCRGEGIGQPQTYRGEAIDEVTYQDRYIKRRKKTFILEYLEPGNTPARQAAFALLASLRNIQVYYNCSIRGQPYLNLMDTVALTAPKLDISAKQMQIIKLVDNMQVANYLGEVELLERQMPTGIPFYWYPAEHDFIINTPDQLIQEVTFGFNVEIESYKFSHSYKVFVSTKGFGWFELFVKDCYGEGTDENFDLPYVVDIIVWYRRSDGSEAYLNFGTLTINLLSETPTSLTIRYILDAPVYPPFDISPFIWPIDWLGTLSCDIQFVSRSPGSEPGGSVLDLPHYPPDQPFAPIEDQPDSGWEYEQEFVEVGKTSDWWFWVLKGFNGKLYAGTYQMNLPRIYSYPPLTQIESFSGGESVYRMVEFNGDLYCASEDMGYAGHIYKRITDTSWVSVLQVPNFFPRPLGIHGGYLYAAWADANVNARLYRTANGTDWSLVKSWSNRHVISFTTYNGQLYLLGGKYPSNDSWAVVTPSWNDVPVICDHPNYPWHFGCEFNGKLYLGQDGGLSIYRYDESFKTKVLQADTGVVYTHRCLAFNGQVYFTFGQAWKATSGNSYLYRSKTGNSGDWELFQIFHNVQNVRAITSFDDELYIGADNILYQLNKG